MSELTETEQKQFDKLRFRRADNSKYFSAFDTKEGAFRCLQEVARKYKYTSLHNNTLADLCEEYQSKGIMLYPTQLGKWMKNVFNVNVRYTGYGKALEKTLASISFDKVVKYQYLDQLKDTSHQAMNMSKFVNEVTRIFLGLAHDSTVVFISDQVSDHPIPVMFYFHKEELQALFFGKVQQQTKQTIRLLTDVGRDEGLDGIKQRANRLGYYTL